MPRSLPQDIKRRQVFVKLVAEGWSYKDAAMKAGYSEKYATKGEVQKTEVAQDYFKKVFPPKLLAKNHKFLINTKQFRDFSCNPEDAKALKYILKIMGGKIITQQNKKIHEGEVNEHEVTNFFVAIPVREALKDGLHMAYNLIGAYAPIKAEFTEAPTPLSSKAIQDALVSLSEQEKILITRFAKNDGKTESAKQSGQANKGTSVHRSSEE